MEKALTELKKKALLDETSQAAYDEALRLFEKHKELHNKQLVADDFTVEKAVTIMKQNNEKLIIDSFTGKPVIRETSITWYVN